MKKIAVIVCTNYEDIELITTIDVLSRAPIDFDLISIENKDEVHGAQNAIVKTHHIDDIDFDNYSGIFIPGGPAVDEKIIKDERVLKAVDKFHKEKKNIYAICAAPSILRKLDILKDIKHTAYPTYGYKPTLQNKSVVKDKNIITANGPAATLDFAFAILEHEKEIEREKQIRKAMQGKPEPK